MPFATAPMPCTTKTDPAVLYKQIIEQIKRRNRRLWHCCIDVRRVSVPHRKCGKTTRAMPDDASANDNVSSARPEPAAFVPTPFDEVIDISDLVAERRRLQRNLWAMRIITIVNADRRNRRGLLPASVAIRVRPQLGRHHSHHGQRSSWLAFTRRRKTSSRRPAHTTRSSLNPASLSWVKPSIRSPPLKGGIPSQRRGFRLKERQGNTSHCLIPATA